MLASGVMFSVRLQSPARGIQSQSGLTRQEILDFLPTKGFRQFFLAAQHALDEGAFAGLQVQDFLLDRAARDELVAGDHPLLPDTVRAIGGLRLNRGIPPRIEMDDS